MLTLYNSLSKKKEVFKPLHPGKAGLYTCGMTVYDFAHIGHGRRYVGDDILRRTLARFGYEVTHVQNVTDVGHLSSDSDEGDDKMEKGAQKAGKNVWEVAEYYTKHFYDSMDLLNILRPHVVCRATDHITEQIDLIAKIVDKGYGYETPEAVYFDVSKFPNYDKLFGQKLADKRIAVREEVETGSHKRHAADFVLWFKRVGRFAGHVMYWASPWGDGFPGWHIECSAMSMRYIGDTIDIHTGGIDHLSVHHPNEIAQSEAATGKQFVRYWVHHAFLIVDGKKMSKSLGNIYTVEDVKKKGFDSLALRYFYLTAHYRKPLNFTWEALSAAQRALGQLRSCISGAGRTTLSREKLENVDNFRRKFDTALEDDLNTPNALAVVWEVVKSSIPPADKRDLILDFDDVLGLGVGQQPREHKTKVTRDIQDLLAKRVQLRKENKFEEADSIRKAIEDKGFVVEDSPKGTTVSAGAQHRLRS
ncbi:cysteine--tRNA ligase [Patescibacteria group bacterium]|nr:cysteine--tRNA ligase [Patescibacteria group bacterium]MBU1472883.1 cysteine--tRNA ligase [Patescibacteria group bacterium]MBU2459784.1 cysteine--tRNA ligase [Patescibacteria group bacterium]MBU2544805.1 cysteine--tRNA ligase [Patescibacteria group bacterium]